MMVFIDSRSCFSAHAAIDLHRRGTLKVSVRQQPRLLELVSDVSGVYSAACHAWDMYGQVCTDRPVFP